MFTMKASTQMGSDCTCGYDVLLDREYTVEDFVNTVLIEKNNEWGYIGIYKPHKIFGDPCCEYRYGMLSAKSLPAEYLQKKIIKVSASGGWTRMDYILWIE